MKNYRKSIYHFYFDVCGEYPKEESKIKLSHPDT